jgi:hypothetical protein
MKKEIKQLEIDHTPIDAFILDSGEEILSTSFKRLLKAIDPDGQYFLTARSSTRGMYGSKVESAWGAMMANLRKTDHQKDDVASDD